MKWFTATVRVFFVLALGAFSANVRADVVCTETVTQVIVHANGMVYFETSATCNALWCQISFATTDGNDKAYAMLLTALATGRTITIDWPNITSCTQLNAVYAIPAFMIMTP